MMWFSAMELQTPEGKGVYNDMDRWTQIRKKILVEGVSKRQVMEEEGIHWETLKKISANSAPPGYQMSQGRPRPKVGPFLGRTKQIPEDDKQFHKKQHHTSGCGPGFGRGLAEYLAGVSCPGQVAA